MVKIEAAWIRRIRTQFHFYWEKSACVIQICTRNATRALYVVSIGEVCVWVCARVMYLSRVFVISII